VGGLGEIQGVVKSDETPSKVPTGLMIGIEWLLPSPPSGLLAGVAKKGRPYERYQN
jgi:hypothetical protein